MASVKRLFLMGQETYFVHEVYRGINEYCSNHGTWEFYIIGNGPERIKQAPTAINEINADGIIAQVVSRSMERAVLRSRLPAVNFSGVLNVRIPTVRTDDEALGRLAAKYFMDNGFRHFGSCAVTEEGYAQRRCQSFANALAQAGFKCNGFSDLWHGKVEYDWVKRRKRLAKWLLSLPRPVAIMCIYDLRAHELAMLCRHHGLHVPEDVAIIGSNNEESICNLTHPPLSSVDLNPRLVGYEAAKLVHQMLRGTKPPQRPIVLPPGRIVVRQSSDVIAIEDPQIADVMRYIRQHANQPVNIKEILHNVPISRRMMELRFVKLIGRTPKEEIMRLRMQLAGTLLESTDLQMPVVAKRSGFAGAETFTRAFRRETGLSPTEYRQRSKIDQLANGRQRHITSK